MKDKSRAVAQLASAARTASGTSEGTFLPEQYDELIIYLDVTAVSGVGPTLDVIYEVSPDDDTVADASARWFTHTTFTQATAATKAVKLVTTPGQRGRIRYTIAGTTPSFTFRVDIEGKWRGRV